MSQAIISLNTSGSPHFQGGVVKDIKRSRYLYNEEHQNWLEAVACEVQEDGDTAAVIPRIHEVLIIISVTQRSRWCTPTSLL